MEPLVSFYENGRVGLVDTETRLVSNLTSGLNVRAWRAVTRAGPRVLPGTRSTGTAFCAVCALLSALLPGIVLFQLAVTYVC